MTRIRCAPDVPGHVAFIPDGNRRHARRHGLSLEDTYLASAELGVDAVGWCLNAGVRYVSTFASSAENTLGRPTADLTAIHRAVGWFCAEVRRRHHVVVRPIGTPGRALLDGDLEQTSGGDGSPRGIVHVAVGYCLDADLAARARLGEAAANTPLANHETSIGVPPIDLVIRAGGQQRLSGFLPLQTRFAELWFCEVLWPDFRSDHFDAALSWYAAQERRFGE
jgi:short-chain Z-isoprenyl diphosphate synthase